MKQQNKVSKTKNNQIQHFIISKIPKHAKTNYYYFDNEIMPKLMELYSIDLIHKTTKQTRIINNLNGKKIDYYPYYRKINDFQTRQWSQLANNGEILTVIKSLLQ